MRLLLDTCALVAIGQGDRMAPEAAESLRAALRARTVSVPAVAAVEIGQKWSASKLRLTGAHTAREWYERAVELYHLRQVPTTADMALGAYELPEPFHRDPADRLIVATARLLRAAVVTVDARILAYGRAGHVATLAY